MRDLANARKPTVDTSARFGSTAMERPWPWASSSARGGWLVVTTGLAVCVLVGFGARLAAAIRLSPHVDEPSSLLAAHAVAERGVPILPSGTAYFQGATLSYLLQPFIWLGVGDIQHLGLMRIVLVVAGTVAVYLAYRLGEELTGSARVGAVMAALVALDPLSVQWSGHLRMYALLQAITIGLAWAYARLLTRGATPRRCALVVLLCWAAVFTHVGAALLGPAMALAAAIVFRRHLSRMRALLGTLALCALAPVTLLALNSGLGTDGERPSSTELGTSNLLTFVGNNLLAPLARFSIPLDEWNWAAPFHASNFYWLVPGLIVAVSTLIGGRMLLREAREHQSKWLRQGVIVLLAFYWLPMVAVGLFTVSPKERYLLNVHALGYLFVAALMVRLAARGVGRCRGFGRLMAHGFAAAVVLALGAGLVWRLEHTIVHPNHNVAMAYVAEHHEPGEPVIVALPPVAWLSLGEDERDDLYFLAGPQDQSRAQRYTRWSEEGELIDYWVGANAIVGVRELRSMLIEYPETWIVVDDERMGAEWAYRGAIERLLRTMTEPVFEEPGGALVLRPAAAVVPGSSQPGTANCQQAEICGNRREMRLAFSPRQRVTAAIAAPLR